LLVSCGPWAVPQVRPHHPPKKTRLATDRRSFPAVLTTTAVGVLPLLRQPIVGLMGAALEAIAAAPDVIAAISALLQVGWGQGRMVATWRWSRARAGGLR
jgi:hypothetical protein